MNNIYLEDSYRDEIATIVEGVRVVKGKPALSFSENIYYPGGGGQPADLGYVETEAGEHCEIARVVKMDGKIYACLANNKPINVGDQVKLVIDMKRRKSYMRYHTAAHVLMGSLRRVVKNYEPNGVDISEGGNTCRVMFFGTWSCSTDEVDQVLRLANDIIRENRAVISEEWSTLDSAMQKYSELYRGPLSMNGAIRLVIIEGWDANPCGGTHVSHLSEIGTIVGLSHGEEFLEFTIQ